MHQNDVLGGKNKMEEKQKMTSCMRPGRGQGNGASCLIEHYIVLFIIFNKLLDYFILKMVYIDSWDEYAKAVEQLCLAEPSKVRERILKYFEAIKIRVFTVVCGTRVM